MSGSPRREMRILHIIASTSPAYGGPIEGILRQHEMTGPAGLAEREIVCLDASDAPWLDGYPMTVHALGRSASGRSPLTRFLAHYRYSSGFVPWLRANAERFDIAFVHGLWSYVALGASRVLPGGRVPYFVFPHGMMDPWFRRQYPLKHLIKQGFWLVGEGRLLAGARQVLFTCEEERLQARGQFFGYRYRERVVAYGAAAPPCVDRDAAAELSGRLSGDGRPFILFLSRIHEKKGCDLLIKGFAAVAGSRPDLRLIVAGPDQTGWLAELQALVTEHALGERVVFPGPLFGASKWAALQAAEAFILPSHQENFGIAVAEALGCGTPVLISDKVNIWREIEAAGAGLVAPDTTEGVVSLLSRWFTLNSATRADMARAAARLFEKQFNVARTAPDLLKVVADEISRDHSSTA